MILTVGEKCVGAERGLVYRGTVSASPGSSSLPEQRLNEQVILTEVEEWGGGGVRIGVLGDRFRFTGEFFAA